MDKARRVISLIVNRGAGKNLFIFRFVFDVVSLIIWVTVTVSHVYNVSLKLCSPVWTPEYCIAKASQQSMQQVFTLLYVIPSAIFCGTFFFLLHRRSITRGKVTTIQLWGLRIIFVHIFITVLWMIYSGYFGVSGFIVALVFSLIFDTVMMLLLWRNRRERIRENEDANMYATSNQELIRN
jgi:hypothetical protein